MNMQPLQQSENRYAASVFTRPMVTLFVPTYNRLATLPRLLDSVASQTFRDFELLIVDDGSTDDSYKFLLQYQKHASFPMRIYYQENQGRHIAFNTAFDLAKGILFTTINSDDILAPDALERLVHWWQVAQSRDTDTPIVGVEGLCASLETRRVIGPLFPESPMIADHIETYFRRGCWGDAMRAIRTEVIRQYHFPQIPGECYLPPSYLWNRLGFERYKVLYFNEVLSYKEYRTDGITKNRVAVRARNPRGAELYFRDFVRRAYADGRIPARWLIRYTANWLRYLLYLYPLHQALHQTFVGSQKFIWSMAVPIGLFLHWRDRQILRRL